MVSLPDLTTVWKMDVATMTSSIIHSPILEPQEKIPLLPSQLQKNRAGLSMTCDWLICSQSVCGFIPQLILHSQVELKIFKIDLKK